jgi:hypothetical protein
VICTKIIEKSLFFSEKLWYNDGNTIAAKTAQKEILEL